MTYRRLLVLALLASACAGGTKPDAGMGPPGMTTDGGGMCSASAPCALTSGVGEQGTIATVGQVNYYSVTVASTFVRPIAVVAVTRPAAVSAVELLFTLLGTDGMTVLGTDSAPTTTGAVDLTASLAVPGPGTYLLTVRDANNTAEDPDHPYTVTATVIEDPNSGAANGTPQTATPLTLGTPVSGYIASAGEISLFSFQLQAAGLVQLALTQAATSGPLQLEMQVLLLSATPDDLVTDAPVAQYQASAPGAAVDVNVIRMFAAGSYLIEISDFSGMNADAAADAEWTLSAGLATNMDPQNQNGMSNDTAATATAVPTTGVNAYTGIISYDGEHEWFHVAMPASTTANIVEVDIDPQDSTQDIQLLWAVGTQIAAPTTVCDPNCGPTPFCVNDVCAYNLVGYHQFMPDEVEPQAVRLRQQGAAEDVYIYLAAQGDDARTTNPYQLTVKIFPDPDPNEPTISNDTIPTATPISLATDEDGGLHYGASGMDSWWSYVDGLGTYQEPEDLDWYALPLPPLQPEPCVPIELDGGDGGSPDAGDAGPDAGVDAGADAGGILEIDGGYFFDDGGALCPVLADGGVKYIQPPDYGMVMHWQEPAGGVYLIGLQGAGVVSRNDKDAGQACLFSFDQRYAHPDGDGGYVLGTDAGDPCFCLPSAQAAQDRFWVRIDAPHRPIPPAENSYDDSPYSWQLDLLPNQLLPTCNGACAPMTQASTCP